MLIAEVLLFIDGNLTISDCGEAETNKSHLYIVNTSKEPGSCPFSVVLSIARLWVIIGSAKLLLRPFCLKYHDCSQRNPIQLDLKREMFLVGIPTPLLFVFFSSFIFFNDPLLKVSGRKSSSWGYSEAKWDLNHLPTSLSMSLSINWR